MCIRDRHIPDMDDIHAAAFKNLGFIVELDPVPILDVVKNSRMIISHGGLGMSSTALLCGIPHLILSHDLEKSLNGQAISKIGVGEHMSIFEITKNSVLGKILDLYQGSYKDRKLFKTAIQFRKKITSSFHEDVALAVNNWI